MKKKHQEVVRNFAFRGAAGKDLMLGAPSSPFTYKYRAVSKTSAREQVSNLSMTGSVLFKEPAFSWPLIQHLQRRRKQFTIEHLSNGSVLVSVPKPLPGKGKILGDLLIRVKFGNEYSLLESLTGCAENYLRAAQTFRTCGAELAIALKILGALKARVVMALQAYQGSERRFLLHHGVPNTELTDTAMRVWRCEWMIHLIREMEKEHEQTHRSRLQG